MPSAFVISTFLLAALALYAAVGMLDINLVNYEDEDRSNPFTRALKIVIAWFVVACGLYVVGLHSVARFMFLPFIGWFE